MGITGKWIMAALGCVAGYLLPTAWIMLVCILMVFYDSYTAYQLSVRVKAKYPAIAAGKFKSK